MGPRNRRRLAIASVIAAVMLAVAAAVLLTRSTTDRSHALPAGHLNPKFVENRQSLIRGMTKQQVLRLVGKPMAKRGRCWLYLEPPDPRLTARGIVKSVDDICFFAGRYSDGSFQAYILRHGKLVLWHPPPLKITS